MKEEKIVKSGLKVDFHIHSYASKHKESDDCVDLSTINHINVLIEKLNNRNINMCSISDHDNFDFEIYERLKKEEGKGSIKKVFPAVEFSVVYNGKVIHVITIFDGSNKENIKKLQPLIFDVQQNKAKYDNPELKAFSENRYLEILKEVNLNVVMIAHQKATLSSKKSRTHDVKDLGDDKFDELVFLDYFESFEFRSKKNEIFNKSYIEKNSEKYKDETLRFVTGSDCHRWSDYPVESEDFQFTYLKCLPTFRGLAMAITNTKRINYVNNFYTSSNSIIKSIDLSINGNKHNIELSKGINVIIGDNSIGKSLLIHKLTNYEYLNDDDLKKNYENYINDKNVNISTYIPKEKISKFDGQGSIRKMFEDKTFDSNKFLNGFFPTPPLTNKYIDEYKQEISNYIEILKNKEAQIISKNKIGNIKIEVLEGTSKTLNLKQVPQTIVEAINSKIRKVGKIVEYFESINEKLKLILKNECFDKDDQEYVNKTIICNNEYIKKYSDIITVYKAEIAKINIINEVFKSKNTEYSKTKTDETGKINAYENDKDNFVNNLVDYFNKMQNQTAYMPNIKKDVIPISKSKVGKYRFVIKAEARESSNEDIINLIRKVLGKSYKDINSVSSSHIPDKFNNKGKETSYNEKLDNFQQEMYNEITSHFENIKAINDARDKNVMNELSTGFNSKIYFDLISGKTDDNGIYIIDQPEDDVSQSSIKSQILQNFYNMSKNKQIIIITHNPQFIVNLDADNVVFLGKDEKDNIYVQNGALEFQNDKYDILKIVADNIEGGIESINERWKRYDKNIYNV